MRRRILLWVLAAALLFGAVAVASEQRVFDQAGLLSTAEIDLLEETVSERRERYGMDVVLLTVADAEGKTTQAYIDDYYDYNSFGVGESHDGILLCIDMDNREINLTTTGKMIDIVTDVRYEEILDAMYDGVVSGEYYAAFLSGLESLDIYVEAGVPENHYVKEEGSGAILDYEEYGGYAPIQSGFDYRYPLYAALVGVVAGGVAVLTIRQRYRRKYEPAPYAFRKQTELDLTVNENKLVNSFVTTRHIPKDPPPSDSSSGGGGGSTVHQGSSGTFHGGGSGRSF